MREVLVLIVTAGKHLTGLCVCVCVCGIMFAPDVSAGEITMQLLPLRIRNM